MIMGEKDDCLNKKTDNENKHMHINIYKQIKVGWVEFNDPSNKIFATFPSMD